MSRHRIVCAGALMGVLLAAAPSASAISTIDQNLSSTPPEFGDFLSRTYEDPTAVREAPTLLIAAAGILCRRHLWQHYNRSPRYLHR